MPVWLIVYITCVVVLTFAISVGVTMLELWDVVYFFEVVIWSLTMTTVVFVSAWVLATVSNYVLK